MKNDADEFRDLAQVATRYGVSASTVRRWIANGNIPKPFQLSPKTWRWPLSVLTAWEKSLNQELPTHSIQEKQHEQHQVPA